MPSSHLIDASRVEVIHHNNLKEASDEHFVGALTKLVDESDPENGGTHDVSKTIHTPVHGVPSHPWLGKYIPGLEALAARYHVGNFVVIRETGQKIFESMPIYARIGMHLLFHGRLEMALLHSKTVEDHLRELSIKEGIVYDSRSSVASIPSFINTYKIEIQELLIQDLKHGYASFNEFFYRKLKPDARIVQNAEDPQGFCSVADCRITVFENVQSASAIWVKGREFTIPNLLGKSQPEVKGSNIPQPSVFEGGSLALFRLAPADYHRFHAPADVIVGDLVNIPGQYYTVNPQAVNEPGFDVFTANRRAILYLTHVNTGKPVAFVAIGALLVGSIRWVVKKGDKVQRGQELGYFAYGGSTVITVFPPGMIKFDADLLETSKTALETLVKVGYSLGTVL